MMRKYRKEKVREDNKKALIIFAVTFSVFIAFMAFYMKVKSEHVELNPVTMCPVGGAKGVVSVLLDMSDQLNLTQKMYIKQYLESIENKLPRYHKLNVYWIGNGVGDDIAFEVCNPGSEGDVNEVTSNPKKLQHKWQTEFADPFLETVDQIVRSNITSDSPIMETIQKVSIRDFAFDSYESKKLIIVSDMIQNTEMFSQYRTNLSYHEFSKTPFARRVATDLRGVEIYILYLYRNGAENIQSTKHHNFWRDYFSEMNGTVVFEKRVEG